MMKILLLEDDQILSESLKEFLELEGYKVDVAYRGTDVFDMTFDGSYDLYILDVNVPDVNGFEVLSSLKPRLYTLQPLRISTPFQKALRSVQMIILKNHLTLKSW